MLSVAPLRHCRRHGIDATLLGPSDAAFLRGVLSRNPHLEQEEMLEMLHARQSALCRTNVSGNPEAQALLQQAVQRALVAEAMETTGRPHVASM